MCALNVAHEKFGNTILEIQFVQVPFTSELFALSTLPTRLPDRFWWVVYLAGEELLTLYLQAYFSSLF